MTAKRNTVRCNRCGKLRREHIGMECFCPDDPQARAFVPSKKAQTAKEREQRRVLRAKGYSAERILRELSGFELELVESRLNLSH